MTAVNDPQRRIAELEQENRELRARLGASIRELAGWSGQPQTLLEDMNEVELKALLKQVGDRLAATLPPNSGFVLLACTLGDAPTAQYLANVQCEDAANWMLETVRRWRAGDYIPRGEV